MFGGVLNTFYLLLNTFLYVFLINAHSSFGRWSLLETSAAEFPCCERVGAGEAPSTYFTVHW